MSTASIARKTAETDIRLQLDLDGSGKFKICTGCGFLDHMLSLFARHGRFDLQIACTADTQVDFHHGTEDVGIVLGHAFAQAMGEKKGITRYGNILLPMDEALLAAAVDISGRGLCVYAVEPPAQKVGDFDTELCEEFWTAFARAAGITLHLRCLCGKNTHHILEGCFKAAARSLRDAVAIDSAFAEEVPSTKGVL